VSLLVYPGISTTTGPNLQDVLIGLDATSKVQTEIRGGQFDSTGSSAGMAQVF